MLALLLPLLVGILHNPGRLLPDLEGVHETQRQTFQYGAAVASHQFTFDLGGDYLDAATLSVVPGAHISAKSAGSATDHVTVVTIDSVTATQVKVTVTVDAVPGAGKTTDVACSINVGGNNRT